jgi:hypothetical protein
MRRFQATSGNRVPRRAAPPVRSHLIFNKDGVLLAGQACRAMTGDYLTASPAVPVCGVRLGPG